jgi:hypothetical protein
MKNRVYQHYKGNLYVIKEIANCANQGKDIVIYAPIYLTNGIHTVWYLDFEEFDKFVEYEGRKVKRFEYKGMLNNI